MKIHIEKVKDLDEKTYKRLYHLNNGRLGWLMRPILVAFKNKKYRYWFTGGIRYRYAFNPDAYAIYAKNDKGTIISWSLLYSDRKDRHGKHIWYAMFFTSKKYRRKGFGREVFNATVKFAEKKKNTAPRYFSLTTPSFFNKVVDRKSKCFDEWCYDYL